MVFPHEGAPSVAIADGRSVSLAPQGSMLKVIYLTPWKQVGIELAVAVFPGGDDANILGSKPLQEQLKIYIMEGLKAKVLALDIPGEGDQEVLVRCPDRYVSIWYVYLTLHFVQRIVNLEAIAAEEEKSHRSSSRTGASDGDGTWACAHAVARGAAGDPDKGGRRRHAAGGVTPVAGARARGHY